MSTILTQQNIDQAKNAVVAYRDNCTNLYTKLTTIINNLRANYFIGDASNGFDVFYTQVTPALTTNLTAEDNSVTALLTQLLDAVDKALLDTVDPDLRNANQNAANNTDGAAANVVAE